MILVTGGAGYIGSHTVLALKNAGYKVLVIDNLSRGHEELAYSDAFEEGDLQNPSFLDSIFKKHPIQAVVHFAASSLVGESMKDPESYYYNNIFGSLNLLSCARRNKIDKIVFSSTAAVYGEPAQVPIQEDYLLNPTNVYGETKVAIENMLSNYSMAYGTNSISFRYFNAAGADPAARTGEDHHPETHLIPIVLDVALGKRDNITIFGKDYATSDGTCVRDYIHVSDLAVAHVLGLEKLLSGFEGKHAFNLGNGHGYSVLEIIEKARDVTGTDIPVVSGERRAGDPPQLVASSEKAEITLGWKREHPDIKDIIQTAWTWHKKRFPGRY